ncbi:MAG: transcriptional repressor [Oscillospiraceae bacterium]|jgi:Fur family ferric uptake transcriptional regulator|nr:transcriptional repressor [Oscillospiraceae bacterium]
MENSERRLKNCGLKITRQRREIIKILEQSTRPVSAENIFLALRQQGGTVSLSTVYRVLEILVNKKAVRRLNTVDESGALFELDDTHRHYLVCLGCHKMFPLDDCPLETYEKKLTCQTGFDVTGHSLEIYGYCRDCCKKKKN